MTLTEINEIAEAPVAIAATDSKDVIIAKLEELLRIRETAYSNLIAQGLASREFCSLPYASLRDAILLLKGEENTYFGKGKTLLLLRSQAEKYKASGNVAVAELFEKTIYLINNKIETNG